MKTIFENFINGFKKQPPGRLITLGFATVIILGALILLLPVSVRDGVTVRPIDALFTSTSAVCVTGLIAIDTADHFTPFGQGRRCGADPDRRSGSDFCGRGDSCLRSRSVSA